MRSSAPSLPPWRCGAGSSTSAAGDRGLRRRGAEDRAVAAGGRDRLAQPQLRETGRSGGDALALEQGDAGIDAGGAEQHLDGRSLP